jgi:hypothetical protein
MKFYREEDRSIGMKQWFVDLPEYPGLKSDLEMVAGADDLLEILGGGESEVSLRISTDEKLDDSITLLRLREEEGGGGAWYWYRDKRFPNEEDGFEVWLCPVMLYVFNGEYPPLIYFDVV